MTLCASRTAVLAAAIVVTAVGAAPAGAARIAAFGDVPPLITKLKVTPKSFKALKTGGPVAAKGGARVTFRLSDGATVGVTYRRATKTGYKAVPGSFTYLTASGDNEMRISGRIGKAALKPGRYRIVLKPVADGAKSAYAAFTIVK